jgi:hypothetical protein
VHAPRQVFGAATSTTTVWRLVDAGIDAAMNDGSIPVADKAESKVIVNGETLPQRSGHGHFTSVRWRRDRVAKARRIREPVN